MTETTIERIALDPARQDGGVLCQLTDGRVFVTVAAEIGKFAEPGDADALAAFRRAWTREPDLFAGPLTPRLPDASAVPHVAPEKLENGFTGELTDRDRARLYAIIQKHHKRYFAEWPTQAQMDNLIDGIGLRVAESIVRGAVDSGSIH